MNPVHSDAVDALGDEAPGVRRGPTHRPGQPCLTCHGGFGPGEPVFAVGGTVYTTRGGSEPLVGATVTLKDSAGSSRSLTTNSAGNFYLTEKDWQPKYPLFVEITSGSERAVMQSRIGGNGSCAACHVGQGDNGHMPAVYLRLP